MRFILASISPTYTDRLNNEVFDDHNFSRFSKGGHLAGVVLSVHYTFNKNSCIIKQRLTSTSLRPDERPEERSNRYTV